MTGAQLRELFHILHNIDLQDLEEAGIITPSAKGGSDWTRFNRDIGTFVLKLPDDRRERLAALIEAKK